MIASILAGLLGVGTSVANHFVNRANIEDARAYNSPAAQMYRLRQAGVNPYSQASNGNVDPGSSSPQQDDFSDASRSVISAVDSFTKREQMRIDKAMTEANIQYVGEKVAGLQLDNQFKAATLRDRALFLWQKTQLAELDWLIKNGIITAQDADNRVKEINAQVQEYLSGQDTPLFGELQPGVYNTLEMGTGYPVVDNAVSSGLVGRERAANIHEQTANIHEQTKFLLDTHQDRQRFEKYRSWREYYEQEYSRLSYEDRANITQHQAEYWLARAAREEIARDYEQVSNMPWANKDIKSHLLFSFISALAHAYNASTSSGKFDFRKGLEIFFKEMIDIDVPSEQGQFFRKNSGAGGTF